MTHVSKLDLRLALLMVSVGAPVPESAGLNPKLLAGLQSTNFPLSANMFIPLCLPLVGFFTLAKAVEMFLI